MMGRLLKAALVGAIAAVVPGATIAIAADMPETPVYVPPPAQFGGWYLRGHIGMTNQDFGGLEHPSFDIPVYFEWLDEGEFDAGMLAGLGVGYQFNEWFRVDLTGEYRGKTQFHALDRYATEDPADIGGPVFDGEGNNLWGTNDYRAKKSEWLLLANAYLDLGTYYGFTPYVGAGIGASYNTISNFRDINVQTGGGGYAGTGHEWNLAWALHAGMAFKATERLTIDFGYSFVDLGDGKTETFFNDDGSCVSCESVKFKDLISHDVKVGFRWNFDQPDYYEPAVVKY
jgi:opacity protein-like surface antigen